MTSEILLVEDNPADARLVELAVSRSSTGSRLSVVPDGDAAMRFLRQQAPYESAARPDLVLLDLNLPPRGGLWVLEQIRDDDALTALPVVVLTSSRAEEDITRTYRLHANSFVTKPTEFEAWQATIDQLGGYWFGTVELPGR